MKDWYGNPIPGVRLCKRTDNPFVFGTDEDGKRYWLHDGIRDYELPYLKVIDTKTGIILYDSRCPSPLLMQIGAVGKSSRQRHKSNHE